MSESGRQTPEYGEYASDEEHASALKRSGVDPAHTTVPAPRADDDSRRSSASGSASSLTTRPTGGLASASADAPNRRGFLDRLATIFLLAFGAVTIIGGASNYLNIGGTLQESVQQLGMGEYHPPEQAAGMGIMMLASQIIFWVVAAVWSYRRISRGKLSWWVPLLAGVLNFIVLSAILGSLLAADPSFIPALSKL